MAKVVGLIGGLNGKLGSAVFSTRRGVLIGRAYQPTVHNPQTKRQLLSRAKFAMAGKIARSMHTFVAAGWQREYPSYEVQRTIGKMVQYSSGIISGIDPTHLVLSMPSFPNAMPQGDIVVPDTTTPKTDRDLEVYLDVTMPEENYREIDGTPCSCGVVIGLYDPISNTCATAFREVVTPALRTEVSIRIPLILSGVECHMFIFAKQIPTAVNEIPTGDVIWKFPSRVSRTLWLGIVQPE